MTIQEAFERYVQRVAAVLNDPGYTKDEVLESIGQLTDGAARWLNQPIVPRIVMTQAMMQTPTFRVVVVVRKGIVESVYASEPNTGVGVIDLDTQDLGAERENKQALISLSGDTLNRKLYHVRGLDVTG